MKGAFEMVDTNALRGIITSKGKSQKDIAIEIGIAPKTFYDKMKKGVFGSDEMEMMIDILDIKNPTEIFFAKEVTS